MKSKLEAITKDIKIPDEHRKCRAVGLFVLAMLIFRCWEQAVRAGCPSNYVPVYMPEAGQSTEVGISTFFISTFMILWRGFQPLKEQNVSGPTRRVCF